MNTRAQVIKICSVVTMTWYLGNLCVSFFIPFLPLIGKHLLVSTILLQYLITIFYAAKAGGMLVFGPATEKLGRKKILLFGIAMIVIGSLGAIFSHDIYQLLFFRLVQGLGVSATILMGRAIVNDLFDANKAVKAFSIIMLIANVVITMLPVMGSYLVLLNSYKIPFAIVTIYALVVGIISYFFLTDTRRPSNNFVFSLKKVPLYYAHVLKERQFIGYTLSAILVVAGEAAFNTASLFVLTKHFHINIQTYGWLLTITSLLSWVGILATGFLVKYFSLGRIFGIGAILLLMTCLSILGQVIVGFSILSFMISMSIFYVAVGIILTIYNVGVVQAHRQMIGIASSLTMFLYFVSSSCGSLLITRFSSESVVPLSIVISILSGLVFLAWLFFVKIPEMRASSSSHHPAPRGQAAG